ncbi:hypothetical protein N7454_008394 [Penicillium verhagenii]|nr:hypothetical protein N7454_008394 [Penicillium verhagenii]
MLKPTSWSWVLASLAPSVQGLGFAIPSRPPSNSSGTLNDAPLGISFEFFAFPAYMDDVASTSVCISNLEDAGGFDIPIRIGGTTQDRATYNASLAAAVSYTVTASTAAPTALTYGPAFIELAGTLSGDVTFGLNRRLDNISNSIAAAEEAVAKMSNLYAFELGNEPQYYSSSDPIADGSTWTAALDATSQNSWQVSVGEALDKTSIVQAGVFYSSDTWNIAELEPVESTGATYVKTFADHYYPQWGPDAYLPTLMGHSDIVSGVSWFSSDIEAAAALSKPFIMGETNSASAGGGGISPTFGAALWIVDYMMQALLVGVERLHFHQGTIGNCQYCWWGRYSMGAPYYGAYTAALALNGATQITQLDNGTSDYATYIIYKNDTPVRALLYNSDYYTTGNRSSMNFTLSGLSATSVVARRLAGGSATARVDQGGIVTIAGQTFTGGTCVKAGTELLETTTVTSGRATFSVAASEVLLIELV